MKDRAAGRACHCQSLFWLLFCFPPEEEKVLHGESTATGCHVVSWPVCLFTCVHLHIFAR